METPMPDIHEIPETSSEERMHVLDRDCWCEPEIIEPNYVRHHSQTPDEPFGPSGV